MTYYPVKSASRCPGCGGWFISQGMSCLVAHAPGTCCHQYETRVEEPRPLEAQFTASELQEAVKELDAKGRRI